MGFLGVVMVVIGGALTSRLAIRSDDATGSDARSASEPDALPAPGSEGRLARADTPPRHSAIETARRDRPASLPITPAFEGHDDPYVIRLPLKPEPEPDARRRDVRLAPLLAILALLALLGIAGALAYLTTRDDDDRADRVARPAPTGEVLGTSTMVRSTPARPRVTAATALGTLQTLRTPARSLFPVPPPAQLEQFDGMYVRARNVRVQSLVGDEAFWIGEGGSNRILVHLTSRGESQAWVRAGSRVSFVGAVAPNPPSAAYEYGIIPGEGAELLERQGRHIEVLASKLSVR